MFDSGWIELAYVRRRPADWEWPVAITYSGAASGPSGSRPAGLRTAFTAWEKMS